MSFAPLSKRELSVFVKSISGEVAPSLNVIVLFSLMGLPNDVSTWLKVALLPFLNIGQLEESIVRVNVVCFSLAVNEYVL